MKVYLDTINQTLESSRLSIENKDYVTAKSALELVNLMINQVEAMLGRVKNPLDSSKTYKVLEEITDWKVDYRQPNHTYLLDGDKIVAYRRYHEGPALFSKTGTMRLDRRHRKFKSVSFVSSDWV